MAAQLSYIEINTREDPWFRFHVTRNLFAMEWYKILLIVLGSIVGLYVFFLLVVAFEYPQRQSVFLLNKAKFENIVSSCSEIPVAPVFMETSDSWILGRKGSSIYSGDVGTVKGRTLMVVLIMSEYSRGICFLLTAKHSEKKTNTLKFYGRINQPES